MLALKGLVGLHRTEMDRNGMDLTEAEDIKKRWQEYLRRNGVAIIVSKRGQNAVLGSNLKHDRMISISFQGKPFNITVIQVYALTSNAEVAGV